MSVQIVGDILASISRDITSHPIFSNARPTDPVPLNNSKQTGMPLFQVALGTDYWLFGVGSTRGTSENPTPILNLGLLIMKRHRERLTQASITADSAESTAPVRSSVILLLD